MRSIDDKGRTERERLADLELKGNISKEQRIELEKKLTDVLAAQRVEIAALSETQDKLNASFEYGTEKALQSYIDEVANVAASAESLMKSAFKGMEDALVEFVSTGKLDFKSLVNSIIADMARITIRQNITGPLANWMQGTSSGIFSFVSNLFGGGGGSSPRWDLNALGGVYASPGLSAFSGSIVNRPTAFAFANGAGLMGEAGPEAILPLKRGSNGKLGVQSGGGRAVNIVVNVSGNSSAPDVRRAAGQGAREALAAFNGAGRYA
jgi:lambda family phage tail tape measure protein